MTPRDGFGAGGGVGVRAPLCLKTELTMLLMPESGTCAPFVEVGAGVFVARGLHVLRAAADELEDLRSREQRLRRDVGHALHLRRLREQDDAAVDAHHLLHDGGAVADRRDVAADIEVGVRAAGVFEEVGALDALRHGRHVDLPRRRSSPAPRICAIATPSRVSAPV